MRTRSLVVDWRLPEGNSLIASSSVLNNNNHFCSFGDKYFLLSSDFGENVAVRPKIFGSLSPYYFQCISGHHLRMLRGWKSV